MRPRQQLTLTCSVTDIKPFSPHDSVDASMGTDRVVPHWEPVGLVLRREPVELVQWWEIWMEPTELYPDWDMAAHLRTPNSTRTLHERGSPQPALSNWLNRTCHLACYRWSCCFWIVQFLGSQIQGRETQRCMALPQQKGPLLTERDQGGKLRRNLSCQFIPVQCLDLCNKETQNVRRWGYS